MKDKGLPKARNLLYLHKKKKQLDVESYIKTKLSSIQCIVSNLNTEANKFNFNFNKQTNKKGNSVSKKLK